MKIHAADFSAGVALFFGVFSFLGVVVFFLGAAAFFGFAAEFALVLVTRPDLVLPRTFFSSTTAGAYER